MTRVGFAMRIVNAALVLSADAASMNEFEVIPAPVEGLAVRMLGAFTCFFFAGEKRGVRTGALLNKSDDTTSLS
jgi:hypothetical protein